MKSFGGGVPWIKAEEQPEVETATPARAASFTSDLVVPLAQALVTGALVGGLVVFLLSELAPGWEVDRIKVYGAVALAVAALAWLLLLFDTRKLLWGIERLTGLDINQDSATGKPKERIVIVNASQGQHETAKQANAQRVGDFARFVAALPARGTSLRAWEGQLGRETYQEFRDVLIRCGWAEWNSTKKDGTPNERKGWSLVKPVDYILNRIE